MTTFNAQVAADADDVYAFGGTQTENNTILFWNYASATELIGGIRFNNVTIANASLIEGGTFIETYGKEPSQDDIAFDIHAEAADDSDVLEGGGQDIDLRTRTTAFVNWTATSTGLEYQQSPDIVAVIQEVIDRGGWSSGNDLTILGNDVQSSQTFSAWDYQGISANASKITIVYTAGGSPPLASQRLKSGTGR